MEERQDEEDAAGVADLRAGLLAREFASVASISAAQKFSKVSCTVTFCSKWSRELTVENIFWGSIHLVGVVVAAVVAAEVGEGGVCWEKECARAE